MNKYYLVGVFTFFAIFFATVETVWAHMDLKYHGAYPPYADGEGHKHLERAGREFLPVGDHADPFLDPLLMKHSFYLDDGIPSISEGTLKFPPAGLSGTAGSVEWGTYEIGYKDACGNTGSSFIQTVGNGGNVKVSANATLTYGNPSNRVTNNGGKVTQVPSGEKVYPVRPKFPDLRPESFKWPDNLKPLLVSGETVTLSPGVHYFDSVTIKNGTLNVMVKNGKTARTIIYVKRDVRNGDGSWATINTVDENGKIIPFSCDDDKRGQVLFVVGGCFMLNRGGNPVDITASIIALGIISLNPVAKIKGQVIADELNAFAGIDLANNIKFAPVPTYAVEFSPLTFRDDKHWAYGTSGWTNNGGEPKYYNSVDSQGRPSPANAAEIYRYGADKNKDYDTMIVVSLSDPIKEGSITLPYNIPYKKGEVEPFNNSNNRNASVLVENATLNGNFLSGELRFTPNKDKDTIRLRIIDLGYYRDDLKLDLTFGKAKYEGDNKILPVPQTITIICDDPKDAEPPLPPEPIIPPAEPKQIDFKVKSAAYFDISNPADGKIDLIKVRFDFDFSRYGDFDEQFKSGVKNLVANGFILPNERMFNKITENDVTVISSNLLEISVSQNINAEVKTSVEDYDKIIAKNMKIEREDKFINLAQESFSIEDSIAPIITQGRYSPMVVKNDGDEIIDTLDVYFSEIISCNVAKEAIKALRTANGSEYYFDFENTRVQDDYARFLVRANINALPEERDSIRIEGDKDIRDAQRNLQAVNTVWAPLGVGKYQSDFDVIIYPNPYAPNGNFATTDGKKDRNPVIEEYGHFAEASNLAVIVKAKGQRTLTQELSGNITILDALGNTIVEDKEFSQGKDGVLIWTWNGKNKHGRTVGAGTYQALISVTDKTENYTVLYSRKIGIKK
ncbi:MAG: hypothetical protein FWF51_09800 [Chitinivibrionia bacterium]|nr:hypothetical protein [Chitinivibrionia bacterium]